MTTFGERLKHIRESSSQAEFAALFGIPQVTLGNYERNRNEPRFELVQRICIHFGINAEWLLFGTGPMRAAKDAPPVAPAPTPSPCDHCGKLDRELDQERHERRQLTAINHELTAENRILWKENSEIREKCARLEERHYQRSANSS